MQDSPSKLELLRALALFLKDDVRPSLSDKGLQFRTLIAANIARIVAAELEGEESADQTEFEALVELLPGHLDGDALSRKNRTESIKSLRLELAKQIRAGQRTDKSKIFDFLKSDLKSKLRVVNPRFSTELEIE